MNILPLIQFFSAGFVLSSVYIPLSGLNHFWWFQLIATSPVMAYVLGVFLTKKQYKTFSFFISLFIFPIVINILSLIGLEHPLVLRYRAVSLLVLTLCLLAYIISQQFKKLHNALSALKYIVTR